MFAWFGMVVAGDTRLPCFSRPNIVALKTLSLVLASLSRGAESVIIPTVRSDCSDQDDVIPRASRYERTSEDARGRFFTHMPCHRAVSGPHESRLSRMQACMRKF